MPFVFVHSPFLPLANESPMNATLITGASSGIGRELARVLARNGHNLIFAARRMDELDKLAAEISRTSSVTIRSIRCDLSTPEGPRMLVEEIQSAGIILDGLINNSGFGMLGPFQQCDFARMQGMIDVNISALTQLTRLILPGMIERKSGRILNVASTAAFQPGPLMAAYFATKAYVLSLSEALSYETRGTGVTVSCLCPGPTKTEFGQQAGADRTPLFDDKKIMSATTVAENGYRGMMAGKRVIVTGLWNRVLAFCSPMMPRNLVMGIVKRYQETK